ncbi:membrane-associated, eicosanoid/glutathione metabolism protein [Melampsora americana]|nr:membrane-associated, eicosanoid/glutathione metabolism protein [Melampsora americana]
MPSIYSSVNLILTPASLIWSPFFVGYYVYLGASVSVLRSKTKYCKVGTGPDAVKGIDKASDQVASAADVEALQIAARAHANFSEQVPISLIMTILAEINGAPTYLVHTLYAALFSLRVAHNELGMKLNNTIGMGRPVGTVGNWLLLASTGIYNLGLGWNSFKSFAGY